MEKKCYSEGDGGEKIRIMRSASDREEGEMIATTGLQKLRNGAKVRIAEKGGGNNE